MRTRTTTVRVRGLGALLAAVLVLTGCAAGGGDQAAEAPEPAAGHVDTDAGETAAGAATESGAGRSTGGSAGDGEAAEALQVGAPLGHKVVFTARLSLQADDTAAAVETIRRAVERVDGFVARADLHRTDDDQVAGTLTLRVPSGQLDTTLAAVRQAADRVLDEGVDSDDVTEEYADVEAQLRNLRALEVELLSLLAEVREKSDDAEQIMAVFERIRQVRGEIERLEGRRRVLDDLVSLATVEVSLAPTPAVAPLAAEEWRPAEVARSSLRATVGALRVVADVAIWVALTGVPVLAVLVGIPLGLLLLVRRARRRPLPWAGAATGSRDGVGD